MFCSTAKASTIRHIRWTITFGRLFSIDLCCFAWWLSIQYYMVFQRWTHHLCWWCFNFIPWKTKQFVEYWIGLSKALGRVWVYRFECSGSCKCYDNTVHTGFVHSLSPSLKLSLCLSDSIPIYFALSICICLIIGFLSFTSSFLFVIIWYIVQFDLTMN